MSETTQPADTGSTFARDVVNWSQQGLILSTAYSLIRESLAERPRENHLSLIHKLLDDLAPRDQSQILSALAITLATSTANIVYSLNDGDRDEAEHSLGRLERRAQVAHATARPAYTEQDAA